MESRVMRWLQQLKKKKKKGQKVGGKRGGPWILVKDLPAFPQTLTLASHPPFCSESGSCSSSASSLPLTFPRASGHRAGPQPCSQSLRASLYCLLHTQHYSLSAGSSTGCTSAASRTFILMLTTTQMDSIFKERG